VIKTIIKIFVTVVIFLLVLAGLFFLSVYTTHQPPEKIEDINIRYTQRPPYLLSVKPSYTAITWDFGFATKGAGIDFYFENGETSIPPRDSVTQWIAGIKNQLTAMDSADFFLFQEIDRASKRSHNIDQRRIIDTLFPQHAHCFANNHTVSFIPFPLRQPYGAVSAGMATVSATYPMESMRYAFEKKGNFFRKPFMKDLCYISNHYRLRNGKSLIIINVSNASLLQEAENKKRTQSIVALMITEYEKGNYVLAGGNWGVTNSDNFLSDFLPNEWEICADTTHPTARSMSAPYHPDSTAVSITDFFIASPNISVLETKTIPLDFQHSPHNPVQVRFDFK
jgi:hypothetical protein